MNKYEELFREAGFSASHLKTIEWVGNNKSVLEIGCASGYMTRVLKEKGCRVTGVEKDEFMAEKARVFCYNLIVGSIEDKKILNRLENIFFDVVVMNDVLEHLVEPEKVLWELRPKLKTDGYLLLSLPNIANWETRRNIFFKGSFHYQDFGVMDNNHLRFFTFFSARALIEKTGYKIADYVVTDFSYLPLEGTLKKTRLSRNFLEVLKRKISSRYPNFGSAHFLFKAVTR